MDFPDQFDGCISNSPSGSNGKNPGKGFPHKWCRVREHSGKSCQPWDEKKEKKVVFCECSWPALDWDKWRTQFFVSI